MTKPADEAAQATIQRQRIRVETSFEIKNAQADNLAHLRVVRHENQVLWLTDLWVDPALRGQGYSRALMAEALEMFGAEDLYIEILPYADRPVVYTTLVRYYADFGFQPTDVPNVYYRVGQEPT